MKNIIMISPNYPENYKYFCRELKNNGMRVLGIGDQPYDELDGELKKYLTEYYKVGSLLNYDEVYKAVAYFGFRFGKIDWLESNNEFWLEQDAALRTDFNITTGLQTPDMVRIKNKSEMKAYYAKAGLATARYHMVQGKEDCAAFTSEVGYPVVVKPDNGVGASHTYKLKSDEDLDRFLQERAEQYPDVPYIMEEFVKATVCTYDAIIGPKGEPMFETGNVTLESLMDVVNENKSSMAYIRKELPEDICLAGRKTVEAFEVENRFVHLEFFRLDEDMKGLGKKGDIIGLEVNMRPSGGFMPDMMNYAHSTNVYKIWADMVAFGHSDVQEENHQFCAFIGRRDGKNFKYNDEAAKEHFGNHILRCFRLSEALAPAMGNVVTIAVFDTEEEMMQFYKEMEEVI